MPKSWAISSLAPEMPARARIVKKETTTTAPTTSQRWRGEAVTRDELSGCGRSATAGLWLAGFILQSLCTPSHLVSNSKDRGPHLTSDAISVPSSQRCCRGLLGAFGSTRRTNHESGLEHYLPAR